jgi:hypothetical protein
MELEPWFRRDEFSAMFVLSSPNAGELLAKLVGGRLMAPVACTAIHGALPAPGWITCPGA